MGVETLDHRLTARAQASKQPGVVAVFSAGAPMLRAMPVEGAITVGREGDLLVDDARLSRVHCEIARTADGWSVRDLGSRNGTFVDGAAAPGRSARPVVRAGDTVLITVDDVVPFLGHTDLRSGAHVIGPAMRGTLASIARIAAAGDNLLVRGESGSGKELAAAHFHAARGKGPFVSVNCAAIPEGVAERLLFGAKKGAYSGAVADADGYVQNAHEGVLFLDEMGELDLDVQAKLLRILETKEVLMLGASQGRKVEVRFCFATHRDLRAAVAAGRFRADLFYRIGQMEIVLPPLRERREEIPWLAGLEMSRAASELTITSELVEALLLRPWPGNVRELLGAVRRAAHACMAEPSTKLRPEHLDPAAGLAFDAPPSGPPRPSDPPRPSGRPAREHPVTREELETALREQPNASAAARALGIHRSHLYRLMKQLGIESEKSE